MDNIIRNSSPDERNAEIWKYIEQRMKLCANQAKEELESSEEYQLDAQIDLLSMQSFNRYLRRLQAENGPDAKTMAADTYELCDQFKRSAKMLPNKFEEILALPVECTTDVNWCEYKVPFNPNRNALFSFAAQLGKLVVTCQCKMR